MSPVEQEISILTSHQQLKVTPFKHHPKKRFFLWFWNWWRLSNEWNQFAVSHYVSRDHLLSSKKKVVENSNYFNPPHLFIYGEYSSLGRWIAIFLPNKCGLIPSLSSMDCLDGQ
jgi:hypothetical protein